ncbi:hypothetical protein chiPu_0025596, partial [Chiloscyllium punctatum]|nr:hypothetical protein [Chiloscyllium punctatum]
MSAAAVAAAGAVAAASLMAPDGFGGRWKILEQLRNPECA